MEYFYMFLTVFFFLPGLLFIVLFWCAVGVALDNLFKDNSPPYCDISPLADERFYWDGDDGYIGSLLVIKGEGQMQEKQA